MGGSPTANQHGGFPNCLRNSGADLGYEHEQLLEPAGCFGRNPAPGGGPHPGPPDVVDPATGERKRIESNSNYYWINSGWHRWDADGQHSWLGLPPVDAASVALRNIRDRRLSCNVTGLNFFIGIPALPE